MNRHYSIVALLWTLWVPLCLSAQPSGLPAVADAIALPAEAVTASTPPANPPPVAPILPAPFLGWTNAYRLDNGQAVAILVPAIGRLVHFSAGESGSPFRLESSMQGQIPPEGDRFFNIGGDWLWPVSQARWASFSDNGADWPPPAVLADLPWECSAWTDALGARCAQLSRTYGAPLHIKVSRLFCLAPGQTRLSVRQRIERTAPSDIPVVLWNISQIARAEQVVLPVETDSRFPGGLNLLAGTLPPPDRLTACEGTRVYTVAPGSEIKLGSDSPRAWLAAVRGGQLILATATGTLPAEGEYPDGGCTVELYSNEGLGYSELETLSYERNLPPGTVLENTLYLGLTAAPDAATPCALSARARQLAGEE